MKLPLAIPTVLVASALVLGFLSGRNVQAATLSVSGTTVEADRDASPAAAQVVGVQWLNPLQRRDYPTEWQLLWTLGLVRPNSNDDMVKANAKKYSSLQPVASIADANGGRETLQGYYEKYVDQLLLLFGEPYVMSAKYFYTVKAQDKRKWRELAGIHVELAIPAGRIDEAEAGQYLRKRIVSKFNIGNDEFTDLWSRDTPPDVHITSGGPNAGFTSLNAALDYLQAHPKESVWVMNWDAPSYPPKFRQINENLAMLILAGPEMKTEREPLAWIGRAAASNMKDFEAKAGTTRSVQAWKATIEAAAHNAGQNLNEVSYVIHDAGKGTDAASERIGSLSRTLTENLPEFDYQKQTFNTAGLLGDLGAGSALTNVALAVARANHLGGSVLVAGTADPDHPVAVVVSPPSKLTPIVDGQDWFRARGENNAYLPWWGHRYDTEYKSQGYSY